MIRTIRMTTGKEPARRFLLRLFYMFCMPKKIKVFQVLPVF
ncbi:hypothetical protein BMETH_879_0 [methanotrophic bacterial endosymbiont of Bathymodiolus sp.]|nr:hypothetical protein BMETH_879_0 [methanotrophic bacterial endosymbiont of Bathymodiolus sp.]